MSDSPAVLPAVKRDSPYIWVTWLTPLLAGSSYCQWAAWFQANFKFEKQDSDMSEWRIKHGRLLNRRVQTLEAEGYTVYIEDENKFAIQSRDKSVKVAGKADIVAIKGDYVVVEDCKTGKKKDADLMQVLSYMMLLPLSGGPPHCRKRVFQGRLVYGEEIIDIPSSMVDEDFKASFRETVGFVGAAQPARRVPSESECRYCKVSKAYCAERIELVATDDDNEDEEHDLF